MKSPPTEPGLYLHIDVSMHKRSLADASVYVCNVGKEGRIWHPVYMTPDRMRGSFIRIPEETLIEAHREAKEVFIEDRAREISKLDGYRWNREVQDLEAEFQAPVRARLLELNPNWKSW